MKKYSVGETIKCVVSGIEPYGVFVTVDDYYTGLIHISEVSEDFVRDVNDYVHINEEIYAKIISIDENNNQMKLSIKEIDYANSGINREELDNSKGFQSLKNNLPIWMNEKLQEYEENVKEN